MTNYELKQVQQDCTVATMLSQSLGSFESEPQRLISFLLVINRKHCLDMKNIAKIEGWATQDNLTPIDLSP